MKTLPLFVALGFLVACTAWGAVPNVMGVQGRLLNAGSPMNGTHPATFKIYDAAAVGALLWTEDNTLDVLNGVYSAILGQTTPLPTQVFSSPSRWLEVTVDGTTLAPRLALTTSAYAFRAQRADTAEVALTGTAGNELWSTDGTNVWRGGGSIGLGTSVPDSIAFYARPDIVLNGSRPSIGLRTTDTGGLATIQFVGPTPSSQFHLNFADGSNPALHLYSYVTNDNVISIHGSGHVGVGTTSPREKLEVSNGRILLTGSGADDTAKLYFINTVAGENRGWGWQAANDGSFDLEEFNVANSRIVVSPGGNVAIAGNLTVAGTKCREVNDPTYGKLYYNAVESGEAIFTTSGRARLERGECHVALSPEWLAGVTIDERHPLDVSTITFYGPHGEWYVVPGATGFDIVDPQGSNSTFFWAVQARQKGFEDLYLDRPEPTATK